MPRKSVFTDVMNVVERRIAEGDYMLKDLPGERRLAEEVGVSYMTARKAVRHLIEKEVLSRTKSGALVVHPKLHHNLAKTQIAMLTPAFPSSHFMHCRMVISQVAEQANVQFRPVEYVHWYDPAIKEAIEGSDGLFVIPSTESIPPQVLREFSNPENKVVLFDGDLTEHGIPSIRLFSRDHITMLFEHLWDLGHRRIDCLNAQGRNDEIIRRIDHWQTWLDDKGGIGTLWDTPAPPYEDPTSRAYQTILAIARKPAYPLGAIVCTTQPAAIGAIRACHEAGRVVGKDVSVCTINNQPTGRFLTPSLTGLEMPDIESVVNQCFDWIARKDEPWEGDLRLVPEACNLLKGESTAPADLFE